MAENDSPSRGLAHDGHQGLRAVAAFEAAKGLLVGGAGAGLAVFGQRRLEAIVEDVVEHLPVDVHVGMPHQLLALAHDASDDTLRWIALAALAYAALRFVEAWGLWNERRWAEWLTVVGLTLYLPVEVFELVQRATGLRAATFGANVVVLAWVSRVLAAKRAAGRQKERPTAAPALPTETVGR